MHAMKQNDSPTFEPKEQPSVTMISMEDMVLIESREQPKGMKVEEDEILA